MADTTVVVREPVVEVVEIDRGTIEVQGPSTTVEVIQQTNQIVVRPDPVEVVEVNSNLLQTFILPEEEQMYAKRVDFVNDTLLYRGEASPGSLESAASWRVRRIQFVGADEDVVEEWADGAATFTQVWDNRASLSYQ